ncbi:hypothetical protein ABEB36_011876 [Hypothenemus hampei]|uniref:Carboxylic ester hydrolase n=1 Tax=Hypothenemus hampei TaxID=57062 RepID=A0ABD1E9K9_HYPHA
MMKVSLVIVLLFWCGFGHAKFEGPLIESPSGKLQGKLLRTRNGRQIAAFMGIPYARPPVGQLRFQPPKEFGPWKGILNATKIHPVCPQRDIYRRSLVFEGDEDCLYLNIYTPYHNETKNWPVMVFFHGGGWLCGGGNVQWYAPDILLDQDVVLVVLNYRLGALGFLGTNDDVVPGNNGLKDQNLALKWISTNIKSFGGNSNSVTIFGESAGGASVHYHMLSPLSRGLFHKAIAMSGTSLCIWACAPQNETLANTRTLARSLNCTTASSKAMIECLKQVNVYDIIKRDVIFMKWDFDPMIPFKPTVEPDIEGAFLTQHPIDIIRSGIIAKVPLIVGITTEDGALRGAGILNNEILLNELNSNFDELIPISLMYDKTALNVTKVTNEIRKFYFNNGEIDRTTQDELIKMYTDGWFLNCADETVQLHRNYTPDYPVYYYLFAHRGVASFTKIFGGGDEDYGVCHADDLQYLFPVGDELFPDKTPSKEDRCVATLFSTSFTNFAATGDPTPNNWEKWLPVITNKMEYYHIDAKSPGMREGLFLERAMFWRTLESNPRKQWLLGVKDEL